MTDAPTAVDSVAWELSESPLVVLSGTGARPQTVIARGARATTTATITGRGKTWKARIPLQASRWEEAVLPLPSGTYDIEVVDAAGQPLPVQVSAPLTMTPSLRVELVDGVLHVGPPIDPVYDTAEGQDALERRYVAHTAPLEEAVFFESFYGRQAACNPLALDREIARTAPGITRYWSVVDLSVAVPEGAVPVVEGSPEWWRARGASRLLIVNDWLRRRYSRRSGQRVLQTWHGSPLKRLALHRPGFDPRRMAASIKESRRWSALLAQNPYAARILRRAYAFGRKPLWIEGYPRNDVLVTGDGAATRAVLGIGAEERVILYAPTWRDDREGMVDFIDPVALAADTDAVILVRGHSRTLAAGRDTTGPRVIDVTGFADVSQLLLVADALVTDYSSVMFDYTVTGKPLFFLVPDIEHYRGELRGFSFDLEEKAPGPLVRTQAQLVEALEDPAIPALFDAAYRRWQSVFNAREDGHAAERVVARLFDRGWLARTP